ncbi:uncharacterized protein LOC105700584 [Orussus abietinus]|uniref:uncharacterized protein LOC105700584 n=1 Tax=Orussus abietinus TaxID=222816 RepID=UPI0006258E15|nr:uncharacterized protein LOC105700584 [Orussus abietinus]
MMSSHQKKREIADPSEVHKFPKKKRECSEKEIDSEKNSDVTGKLKRRRLEKDKKEPSVTVRAKNILNELEKVKKREELPAKTLKKLKGLRITFNHAVPQQHKIENHAGSRQPTRKQKELFEQYVPIKRGMYTSSEDKIIIKNWEDFCKQYNWDVKDVKPFLYMRHNRKIYICSLEERLKFVQFLANGLPSRTLYSVYQRFRKLYDGKVRKRYSKEEDKTILAHMRNNSPSCNRQHEKFSELAVLLHRGRNSIWRRYQILKRIYGLDNSQASNRNVSSRIHWTLPMIEKFIKYLLKYTLNEDIQYLKNAVIPKVIWEKMENKMNIDWHCLKKFWLTQLHMQLFCNEPIYLNDIKIKLIEYFYATGASSLRDVSWTTVKRHFNGMTSTFLSYVFNSLLQTLNSEIISIHDCDVFDYLHEKKIPQIINSPRDKYLPRISLKNGKVTFLSDTTDTRRDFNC